MQEEDERTQVLRVSGQLLTDGVLTASRSAFPLELLLLQTADKSVMLWTAREDKSIPLSC